MVEGFREFSRHNDYSLLDQDSVQGIQRVERSLAEAEVGDEEVEERTGGVPAYLFLQMENVGSHQ